MHHIPCNFKLIMNDLETATSPSEDLSVTEYTLIESQDIWPPTFTLAVYPKAEKFKDTLEWLL